MANAATARAFQYGLGIFTLTVLIGLANATKLFGTLDQNTLLTHLHSGTLGWITMGVIGIAIWMYGGSGATLARGVMLSALATAAYVLAFWSGYFPARALFGVIELVVVVGWWWWTLSRARAEGLGRIDVPKLSVLLGLTTLLIGSTIGVIIQLQFAFNAVSQKTSDLIGGHAGAQVGGYLVLIGAGVAEWQLTGGGRRTRAGLAQAWLLFLGGLLLAAGLLMGIQPLLGLATLFQVVGIVIVAVRLGRSALRVSWTVASGIRHIAIAVPFLILGLILEIALLQQFIAAQGDINKVSAGLNHALDHTMFVALMTNVLFGSILALSADRPRVWPWADHVIFWGLNIGAASFIAVLLVVGSSSGAGPFTHPVSFTAPIMGLAALLGIVTLSMRLAGAPAMATAPARA